MARRWRSWVGSGGLRLASLLNCIFRSAATGPPSCREEAVVIATILRLFNPN